MLKSQQCSRLLYQQAFPGYQVEQRISRVYCKADANPVIRLAALLIPAILPEKAAVKWKPDYM